MSKINVYVACPFWVKEVHFWIFLIFKTVRASIVTVIITGKMKINKKNFFFANRSYIIYQKILWDHLSYEYQKLQKCPIECPTQNRPYNLLPTLNIAYFRKFPKSEINFKIDLEINNYKQKFCYIYNFGIVIHVHILYSIGNSLDVVTALIS